jgi:hypothetical protein
LWSFPLRYGACPFTVDFSMVKHARDFMHNLIRGKELFIKSQIFLVHKKLNTSESCICILLMNLITETNITKTIAISFKMLWKQVWEFQS